MPHGQRGDQHILSGAGPEVAAVSPRARRYLRFSRRISRQRRKEEPCRASAAVRSFDSGISSSAQSFSVLVNVDSAHGGTPLSPPIGIAMDPSNNFRKETMRPSTWSGLSKLNFWKMAVTLLALCGATAISLSAQTLTTLHTFAGYSTDGASPYAGLVQATDGNFYGTTYAGGTSGNCQGGCGTVFRITPAGTLTTLHSFDWYDGASPTGALVQGNDGNFYGTTYGGGAEPARWYRIQNHPGGRADHAVQLLRASELH